MFRMPATMSITAALSAILFGLCCITTLNAESNPSTADDVIKSFAAHVEGLSVDDELKQDVLKLIESMKADEYSKMETITESLARIYPDYDAALSSAQSGDVQTAMAQLRPFIDSGDSFLAADASFFLSRILMNEERFEEALPLLESITDELGDYSLHEGPAVYFAGVAHASLLENQRALKSFARFLDQYPDAPERLRVAAWRQLQSIQAIREGEMNDVLQRMDYSRRRLAIQKTDETTQQQQDKIVQMLAKLIREQEKKECSGGNCKKNSQSQQESQAQSKAGQSQGQGKSTAGGTSRNPNGVVRRTYDDGPASPWSQLRDRTRDAANNAVKQKLPARYRSVVEKYYQSTSGNDRKDDQ